MGEAMRRAAVVARRFKGLNFNMMPIQVRHISVNKDRSEDKKEEATSAGFKKEFFEFNTEVKRMLMKQQEMRQQEMKQQEMRQQEMRQQEMKQQEMKQQEMKQQEMKHDIQKMLQDDDQRITDMLSTLKGDVKRVLDLQEDNSNLNWLIYWMLREGIDKTHKPLNTMTLREKVNYMYDSHGNKAAAMLATVMCLANLVNLVAQKALDEKTVVETILKFIKKHTEENEDD